MDLKREGYVRARVDKEVVDLSEDVKLDRYKIHTIEVVVDRLSIKPDIAQRLAESVEAALRLGDGVAIVNVVDREDLVFSEKLACPNCSISFNELQPRLFSFNSPFGACPVCTGLGFKSEFDPELIFDFDRSLSDGAVRPYNKSGSVSDYYNERIAKVASIKGIDMNVPLRNLPSERLEMVMNGCGEERFTFTYRDTRGFEQTWSSRFEGVIKNLERRYKETTSETIREDLEVYMSTRPCPECKGARLRPEALAVTVGGKSIVEVTAMSTRDALEFFSSIELTEKEQIIAKQVLKEVRERLGFLVNVGLDYLALDRASGTLSGGEAQRIRLATQIGSSLVGVLYILDEPSIGLHQRDNNRLIAALKDLKDLGNTLIVVEHDEDMMKNADHIIDIGPGAGSHGGEVIAQGTVEEVEAVEESITGQFLSGKRRISVPKQRRVSDGRELVIRGACENNLKDIDVRIPLGQFICVTGVSGSGKSTLVNEILQKKLSHVLHRAAAKPGKHRTIEGIENLDKVINIDQSPIGRTPRSNPATYTGVFDFIRSVFSEVPESRARGYKPARFSFNVKGGRCEACHGDGIIKIEMHFLSDIYVPLCRVCHGKRYNRGDFGGNVQGKEHIRRVGHEGGSDALEFFK